MEYGEIIFDNDHIVFELSQAARQAAEGWRFRHHRGPTVRVLVAAWAAAKRLVGKALAVGKPRVALARRRLSV